MLPEVKHALNVAERVARAVVPELEGRPLYLIQPAIGSLVPPSKGAGGGLFVPNLAATVRPQLEAEGRWRGPGPAVVVDAFWLMASAADDDVGLRRVVGVALHELAHWLDRPESTKVVAHADWLEAKSNLQQPEPLPCGVTVTFLTHGESFTRACCHLWYRATRGGGMVMTAKHLGFGSDYPALDYLHRPDQYIDAIWPELESRKGEPLRQILKSDPPSAFAALWNQIYERFIDAAPAA